MFIGPLLLLVVAPALRRIFLARDTADTSDSEAAPDAEHSQDEDRSSS
jgi:hypothetical protein